MNGRQPAAPRVAIVFRHRVLYSLQPRLVIITSSTQLQLQLANLAGYVLTVPAAHALAYLPLGENETVVIPFSY